MYGKHKRAKRLQAIDKKIHAMQGRIKRGEFSIGRKRRAVNAAEEKIAKLREAERVLMADWKRIYESDPMGVQ